VIAVDTNILVRMLLEDDAVQTAAARRLLEGAEERGEECVVSEIVLCELVWVLARSYRLQRQAIAGALEVLLSRRPFVFSRRDLVTSAVHRYATGSADFADYLVAEDAFALGSHTVFTFDKVLLKEPGFARPPEPDRP
jgi:predicted nucleic-acid-binding protein